MILAYDKAHWLSTKKEYRAHQILKGGSVLSMIHFDADSLPELRLKIVAAGHVLAGRLINDECNGKWLVKTDDNELTTANEAFIKFSGDQLT